MAKPKPNRRLPGKEHPRKGRTEAKSSPSTGMAREIAAVVVLALALAGGLAFATYSPVDGGLISRGLSPLNLVGPVGHRTASFLFHLLGVAAPVLALALAAAGWRMLRGAPPRLTVLSSVAYAVLMVSTAALAHLALTGRVALPFPAGGLAGAGAARASVRFLSTWGSAIALSATAVIALIVAADMKVLTVVGALWGAFRGAFAFGSRRLVAAVDEHRAAVAELRAEEAERSRQAAEELADSAEIEAGDEASREEARAAAGVLALEQVRRQRFEDPAWVDGIAPPAEEEAEEEEAPRRRRPKDAEPAAAEARAEAEGDLPAAPGALPGRPEIVVSQALLERPRRKDRRKEAPSFAFQKSGQVFGLPPADLLDVHDEKARALDEKSLTHVADVIVATLNQHGVEGVIRHIRPGPVVTLYEFSPVAGVKLARIENLDKELTMALSATRIRIIAPIPGKGVVGIEVPNKDRATVWLRDLLESETFAAAGGLLPIGLGKNIEGIPYCVDLQRMPHLLVAGTTGSA